MQEKTETIRLGGKYNHLFATIDAEDYEKVKARKWHYEHGYARSVHPTKIYLHTFLVPTPKGFYIDHINRDPLDNRRSNLRIVSPIQNSGNRAFNKNNTSGYKGVGWHKQMGKWRAYIEIAGKHKALGLFNNKDEAAKAYNLAAKQYFGDCAWINKI